MGLWVQTWAWLSREVLRHLWSVGSDPTHMSPQGNTGDEGSWPMGAPCLTVSQRVLTVSLGTVRPDTSEPRRDQMPPCSDGMFSNVLSCSMFCPFTQIVTDVDLVGMTWFQDGKLD